MKPGLVLALGLVLVGCGGATGGSLVADAQVSQQRWVALDLASGDVTPVAEPVDATAARWRTDSVLFRQIEAGGATVGRAVADTVTQPDEQPQRRVAHQRLWIAAHELTQAQWVALAGTRPWLAVLPVADPAPWLGGELPAFGLSPDAAEAAVARWGRDGWVLDLPEADEWERLCLAGTDGKFAWGDSLDQTTWQDWAVFAADHPAAVGGRQANAWGLHDVHGNVWELVRDGGGYQVRGGAWDQPVVTGRASNRLPIATGTAGWNVGLRPVLRR